MLQLWCYNVEDDTVQLAVGYMTIVFPVIVVMENIRDNLTVTACRICLVRAAANTNKITVLTYSFYQFVLCLFLQWLFHNVEVEEIGVAC